MLRPKEKMIEPVVMNDAAPAHQVLWRPSLVVGAAAVLVCLPALGGEFVWDDVLLIEHNQAMDDLTQVWRTAWGDFFQQGGAQLSTVAASWPNPCCASRYDGGGCVRVERWRVLRFERSGGGVRRETKG